MRVEAHSTSSVPAAEVVTHLQSLGWLSPDEAQQLRARIAELEAALQEIVKRTKHSHPMSLNGDYCSIARAALAGGKP